MPSRLPLPLAAFGLIDWFVLGAYLATMLVIGVAAAWRESRYKSGTEEFFLGGRSMPTWALAISIVGSSLSAATFIGVPDDAFAGNLSYLILFAGNFIAVFLVGFLFVPRLYRAGTVTIYGYLAQRFGEAGRIAVSVTFIFGRLLASGARLMLAAVPLVMLVRGVTAGEVTREQMVYALLAIGFVGTFYTAFGGIKTVVWVDTIQFILVVGAALLTVALLLSRIDAPLTEVKATLGEAGKLKWLDLSFDLSKPYTLWAALTGQVLVAMAAYGVDHDLAQRFLVAKSPARGALSVIASQFIAILVVSLFLAIGLLLHVYYDGGMKLPPDAGRAIYQLFLMRELPPVVSGLAMAGLFAVAQGSMDSAINALASSVVADIYLPLRKIQGRPIDPDKPIDAPKWAVAAMGAAMTLFAIGCVYAFDPKGGFLKFALGVLNYGFSGMLAVFLVALLTRRGNSASVIAALVTGVVVVALTQDWAFGRITSALFDRRMSISFTWAMPLATGLAFLVCLTGRPRPVTHS